MDPREAFLRRLTGTPDEFTITIAEANPYHDQRGRFAAKGAVGLGDVLQIKAGSGVTLPPALGGTAPGLTADEQYALNSWQDSFADVDYIQANPDSKLAQDFNAAVDQLPVVNGTVYRGIREYTTDAGSKAAAIRGPVKFDAEAADVKAQWDARIGSTIKMNEPVSTSQDFRTASLFGNTVFEVKGGGAHDLRPASSHPEFDEAVMKPGTFKVTGTHLGPPAPRVSQGTLNADELLFGIPMVGIGQPYHSATGPTLVVTVERTS